MDDILRAPTVYFNLGPIEIDETIIGFWVIAAILILVGVAFARNLKWLPEGKQNLAEVIVEGVEYFVVFIMGASNKFFAPFIGTLILLILLANTAGVWSFGLIRPPTADPNFTLGLGLLSFLTITIYAIKVKGIGKYIKSFFEPFFLFLPINLIGELSKPVSLGFRLFGNIFGGLVIGGLIYQAFPFILPIPLHIYFDLFAGTLQAAVFAILTMVFISMAMD